MNKTTATATKENKWNEKVTVISIELENISISIWILFIRLMCRDLRSINKITVRMCNVEIFSLLSLFFESVSKWSHVTMTDKLKYSITLSVKIWMFFFLDRIQRVNDKSEQMTFGQLIKGVEKRKCPQWIRENWSVLKKNGSWWAKDWEKEKKVQWNENKISIKANLFSAL